MIYGIRITESNCKQVISAALSGVKTCSNKKRKSKKAELYLRCGGGYDTESTTVTDDTGKPKFAFIYHVQMMINGQYMYFYDVSLIPMFFQLLCEQVQQFGNAKLIIWIANLAHEYAFIKRQLCAVGITDLFAKTERQPLKIVLQNCVELREALGLWGSSLADVAKKYTKTQKLKGDLDYNLIRLPQLTALTDTEQKYCYNDVKILDELSHVAFEKFTDQGLKIPMTNTGILRQKCKKAIHNIKWEYKINEKLMPEREYDYYLMRRYMYAGGLSGTSPIYAGTKVKKAKSADLTSDYPAQMNHMLFPAGKLIECSPDDLKQHKEKFKIILFTCDLRPVTKHAIISKHKVINMYSTVDCPFTDYCRNVLTVNGKILYGDNVCLMLNDVDLKALSGVYKFNNIKVYRAWYFTDKKRPPKFLLNCMNEDYLQKQVLKATGQKDTTIYMERKISVNSYYGMCATRLYDCIYQFDEDINDIDEHAADLSYNERRQKMWLSPYIAYWTTSYARAILINYIGKYPDLILQYDTDSLYYITDTDVIDADRLKQFEDDLLQYNRQIELQNRHIFKNDIHFLDLGAWEIDDFDYIGFKGLGAKRYLLQYPDGHYKPVVAGMVKSSFDTYLQQTGQDAFDVFDSDLTISKVISKKLASVYSDGILKTVIINGKEKKIPDYEAPKHLEKVTDYQGHTAVIEIGTYHALYSIDFSVKDLTDYLEMCENIEQEKALPPEYRDLYNYMKGMN